jgi:ParB family chromosome partitioning protein
VEAVAQLVDGRLTQKEAVRYAARQEQPTRTKQPAVGPVKIRVGRLEFCQYHARGTSLRIEFRSEEQRLEAEAVIAETLQLLAERAKTGTSAGSSNYEHLEKSST